MSKITESKREHISDGDFAFPKERKEPIHDAAHVRNAIARFNQVQGVSDAERDAAWKRIRAAAEKEISTDIKYSQTWFRVLRSSVGRPAPF